MKTNLDLVDEFQSLNGASYKSYMRLRGKWEFNAWTLMVDSLQSDPYAPPSRMRVIMPLSICDIPEEKLSSTVLITAVEDYINRTFAKNIKVLLKRRKRNAFGKILISRCSQEIIKKNAVKIHSGKVEIRFAVELPADGRRIRGNDAKELLCDLLPKAVMASLLYDNYNHEEFEKHLLYVKAQEFIRNSLKEAGMVAFIADGAILPRKSGIDSRPMDKNKAVPFKAPESLSLNLEVPGLGTISGMGIPEGVSMISGGGYHGKSTLLDVIRDGIYNHIPGDGRELCVSRRDLIKLKAENGRSISGVDISAFISNLPSKEDTEFFYSNNASGSTSQAAAVMEAVEAGAGLLLLDEDTSATNFMIRDRRMQLLINKEDEPITPFIYRVRELYKNFAVSTVLVSGGSGDYLDVADTLIIMKNYLPTDGAQQKQSVLEQLPSADNYKAGNSMNAPAPRHFMLKIQERKHSRNRFTKLAVKAGNVIQIGDDYISMVNNEHIVHNDQLSTIAHVLLWLYTDYKTKELNVVEMMQKFTEAVENNGLGEFIPGNFRDLALPSIFDIAFALNRWRGIKVKIIKEQVDPAAPTTNSTEPTEL